MAGSIFSLIAATVGSGNITLAYSVMKNGYILGCGLIILGAILSYYTSMLLIKSSDYTKKVRYDDIAQTLYGPICGKVTSILCLLCLNGFSFSFIVYLKSSIPYIAEIYTDN
jgi:amino acid permease